MPGPLCHNDRLPLETFMRLRVLSCLFLLALSLDLSASDLYTAINRLRTGGGNCAAAEPLPPLKPDAALERAARDLARGIALQQGLKAAGYRATRSSALNISGDGVGAQAAKLLDRQSYCRQLQDAAMAEVGIYLDARQVWIVMAAPFAPSVGQSEQDAGRRVLDLVNQARATPRKCGSRSFDAARPLRWNDALAGASRLHAEDMAHHNYFSHNGRDGSEPAQRVERAGYRYRATGENIAAGQMKPEDAVAGWIKSPQHCANLMHPAFTEMGVAYAVDSASDMGVYWAQEFGAPR
jgi:uncharacterized protein YkwD